MSDIAKYEDLYEFIVPELRDCPLTRVLSYIKRTARKFCHETNAWIEWLPAMALIEDRTLYNLVVDYDASIRRVKEVRINTETGVSEGTEGQLIDPTLYKYDYTTCDLTLEECLKPIEDVSRGLEVQVIMVPSKNAEAISDCFLDRWQDAIIAGTLMSLMSMDRRPWTDLRRAEMYESEWNDQISEAKSDHHLEGTERPLLISA